MPNRSDLKQENRNKLATAINDHSEQHQQNKRLLIPRLATKALRAGTMLTASLLTSKIDSKPRTGIMTAFLWHERQARCRRLTATCGVCVPVDRASNHCYPLFCFEMVNHLDVTASVGPGWRRGVLSKFYIQTGGRRDNRQLYTSTCRK